MNKKKDFIKIGLILIALSVILHGIHYMVFHDIHHIMMFLVGDIAFVPLEVFLVTVVIDRMLEKREKDHLMEKLNMLIGLFFQKLGTELLNVCAKADENLECLQSGCHVTAQWETGNYGQLENMLKKHPHHIDMNFVELDKMFTMLDQNQTLLVSLIANPSLLEHDTFSNLLMAVTHLHEELAIREQLNSEDESRQDREHLKLDLERVYKLLTLEWSHYMNHLQSAYPYLFATAMINNPFERRLKTEIEREVRVQLYERSS